MWAWHGFRDRRTPRLSCDCSVLCMCDCRCACSLEQLWRFATTGAEDKLSTHLLRAVKQEGERPPLTRSTSLPTNSANSGHVHKKKQATRVPKSSKDHTGTAGAVAAISGSRDDTAATVSPSAGSGWRGGHDNTHAGSPPPVWESPSRPGGSGDESNAERALEQPSLDSLPSNASGEAFDPLHPVLDWTVGDD